MNKKSIIKNIIPFIFIFFFMGCTHINEFARFNLSDKTIMIKQYVNPDLTRVNVDLDGYYCDRSLISVILSGIGGSIAESSVREKVMNAVNSDSIAYAISLGIADGLETYFRANIVEDLEDNPQFIAETRFERFRIASNTSGVYAMIDTRVLITDRFSAKTVWENTECANIPIGDVIYDFTCNRYIHTAKGVINAVRLMQMSEEEIRAAVNIAAGEAGKRQSDQLREDIANKNDY
jgi:hypothetical protein